MDPQATLRRLLKRRPDTHKYDYGHVLVAGGSPGMVGAPLLAAEAALRSGAGLVTVASRPEVIEKLEKRVREVMTLRLPASKTVDELLAFINERHVTVLVIGPGMAPDFAADSPALLSKINIPAVVDGGALGALAGRPGGLKQLVRRTDLVLTPHAGEFHKLTGQWPPGEREKLRQAVADFARDNHLTLVFKGDHTLVAHPDGRVYENETGNPGLATAGTGDVLSGIIAALVAQLPDLAAAVEAAVYLHGLAGDLAAQAKTQPALIASDVINQLASALSSL